MIAVEPDSRRIEQIAATESDTAAYAQHQQKIAQEERVHHAEPEFVAEPVSGETDKTPEPTPNIRIQMSEAQSVELSDKFVITHTEEEMSETEDTDEPVLKAEIANIDDLEPIFDETPVFDGEIWQPDIAELQSTDPIETFELLITDLLFIDQEEANMNDLVFTEMPKEAESSDPGYMDLLKDLRTGLFEISPEQKVLLEPTLHEIVEIVQFIQFTELVQGDEEIGDAIVSRLTNLCRTVLERLDVEYEETDFEELVRVLMTARTPSVSSAKEIELILRDDVGTHERKHFKQFVDSIDTASAQIQQMLGMMALLQSHSRQPQLVLH